MSPLFKYRRFHLPL